VEEVVCLVEDETFLVRVRGWLLTDGVPECAMLTGDGRSASRLDLSFTERIDIQDIARGVGHGSGFMLEAFFNEAPQNFGGVRLDVSVGRQGMSINIQVPDPTPIAQFINMDVRWINVEELSLNGTIASAKGAVQVVAIRRTGDAEPLAVMAPSRPSGAQLSIFAYPTARYAGFESRILPGPHCVSLAVEALSSGDVIATTLVRLPSRGQGPTQTPTKGHLEEATAYLGSDGEWRLRVVGWFVSELNGEVQPRIAVTGSRAAHESSVQELSPMLSLPRHDVLSVLGLDDWVGPVGFDYVTLLESHPDSVESVELRASGSECGDPLVLARQQGLPISPRSLTWSQDCLAEFFAVNAWSTGHEALAQEQICSWSYRPLISVLMPHWNSEPALLHKAVDSLRRQWYTDWELCIADDGSDRDASIDSLRDVVSRTSGAKVVIDGVHRGIAGATNLARQSASGAYFLFLDQDDELTPNCLFEFVRELQQDPHEVLYSDSARIDTHSRLLSLHLKTDFDPVFMLSHMYLSHSLLVSARAFDLVGGLAEGFDGAQDYEFALRLVERFPDVAHVPVVTHLWRAHSGSTALGGGEKSGSVEANRRALETALERRGVEGAAAITPDYALESGVGINAIQWMRADSARVLIVIPFRNRSELLERCLGSLRLTDYENVEVVLVDDQSDQEVAVEVARSSGYEVVRVEDRSQGFNFSALINLGAAGREFDFLMVFNSDIQVCDPGWLQELVSWSRFTEAGVAGCRLLFPGGDLIQHAGLLIDPDTSLPVHLFEGSPAYWKGFSNLMAGTREVSAVTFAAALVSRAAFDACGGLDESLPRAYQDPDFCLRARAHGYRTIVVPSVTLLHDQGASKGASFVDETDRRTFLRRWAGFVDPYFNRQLEIVGREARPRPERSRVSFPMAPLRVGVLSLGSGRTGAPLSQVELVAQLAVAENCTVGCFATRRSPLLETYRDVCDTVSVASGQLSVLDEFANWLESYLPDVVYLNTLEAAPFAVRSKELGFSVLWNIREHATPESFFEDGAERELARSALLAVDRVVFVSRATRDLFASANCAGRSLVIENGLPQEWFRAPRDENERTPRGVVSVGTLCARKAPHLLLEALRSLQIRGVGTDLPCTFVGGFSPGEPAYERLFRQTLATLPHPHLVTVTGEVDDVRAHILRAAVFVSTSLEESFPRVGMEAMACSRPVVAFDIAGFMDQVEDQVTGYLLQPGDTRGLSESLRLLMSSPESAEAMGQAGRRQAESSYRLENVARRYSDALRQLREGAR
jgi:GT2 family glycosyltransferase/glycosyltransferase involved in cell wall biosynthesis